MKHLPAAFLGLGLLPTVACQAHRHPPEAAPVTIALTGLK
jgi:hypothetical protein